MAAAASMLTWLILERLLKLGDMNDGGNSVIHTDFRVRVIMSYIYRDRDRDRCVDRWFGMFGAAIEQLVFAS